MKSAGIICEYNPIHTGHAYQIEYAKATGADCVICVMSGNFTQRAETAIADKYTRAETAIAAGADLVLELPFPFSSFSAEYFAKAGVHILSSLGVESLCFGHEIADTQKLFEFADIISSDDFSEKVKTSSFFEAFESLSGKRLMPNDILAVSYIKAAREISPDMQMLPLHREGSNYSDKIFESGKFPSATSLREALMKNSSFSDIPDEFIPDACRKILKKATLDDLCPTSLDNASDSAVSFFRLLSPEDITERAIRISGGKSVAEDGDGLVCRLCNTAQKCVNIEELLKNSYNSRFTDARVRRVLLFSMLGVSDAVMNMLPSYTTLLAANSVGCKFLSETKKTRSIDVVTKPADAEAVAKKDSPKLISPSLQNELIRLSDSFYTTCMPTKREGGYFTKCSPVISDVKKI